MTVKETALRKLQRSLVNGEELAIHEYVENRFGRKCYCAVGHLMKECGVDMETLEDDSHLNTRAIFFDGLYPMVQVMEKQGFTLEELETLQEFNDKRDFESLLSYTNRLLGESH